MRLNRNDVDRYAVRLRAVFAQHWPEAARLASEDPVGCLGHVADLEVSITDGAGGANCPIAGDYDGQADPPLLTICRSDNGRRDGFTALHELGHHLLYDDSTWQYEICPKLKDARIDEERVVNSFAAGILIGDTLIAAHLCPDVTANGIRALACDTRASLAACCVRALERPGDRLVMIASPSGRVWFSSSSGDVYNPGRRVIQPMLADAAERARSGAGSVVIEGGEGLRYASGRSWLEARADVCVSDDVLIAVITRGRHKRPDETSWSSWTIECPQCAQEYTPKDSPGECFQCGQSRCPRCGACDCPRKVRPICRECFTELSASEASNGRTLCGQCE